MSLFWQAFIAIGVLAGISLAILGIVNWWRNRTRETTLVDQAVVLAKQAEKTAIELADERERAERAKAKAIVEAALNKANKVDNNANLADVLRADGAGK